MEHDIIKDKRWPWQRIRKFPAAHVDPRAVRVDSYRHEQRCPRCFFKRVDSIAYQTDPGHGQNVLACQVCGWSAVVGGWGTSTCTIEVTGGGGDGGLSTPGQGAASIEPLVQLPAKLAGEAGG